MPGMHERVLELVDQARPSLNDPHRIWAYTSVGWHLEAEGSDIGEMMLTYHAKDGIDIVATTTCGWASAQDTWRGFEGPVREHPSAQRVCILTACARDGEMDVLLITNGIPRWMGPPDLNSSSAKGSLMLGAFQEDVT